MSWRALVSTGTLFLMFLAVFSSASISRAHSSQEPAYASFPYELVDAVNALRASFNLPLYHISPILMSTAQAQADYLASTGSMTHTGPGGIGLTDRLLAAGYPLAGDLSLGGFRAENITGGNEDMPAEAAVDQWTGDALHLNTMVSQALTEIGAGVAVSNGRVYYVIDAALPTTTGEGQAPAPTTTVENQGTLSEVPLVIIPVSISTPNAEGHIIHQVKPGQTLWQIAITYETKIDEIKRLNGLLDNNIYPGNNLLIRSGVIAPTSAPTELPARLATSTSELFITPMIQNAIPTSRAIRGLETEMRRRASVVNVMTGIIVLALIGGGILTWLGSRKKK